MKNIIKFILFTILVGFTFNSFAATWSANELSTWSTMNETLTWFTISTINVIDDRNLELIFSKDLAREPLNLKLYDSLNLEIPVNSVTIWTWTIKDSNESRKEVYVFTSTQLKKDTNYYVIISNARSMEWDIIKQDKKDIDSKLISNNSDQSFKTEETLNESKSTEIKNNIINNPNTINELKSASDKKVIETEKNIENSKLNSSNKEINPINDVSKLPKTWPGETFIFVLLSLLFAGSLFYFRKTKQI